MIKEDSSIYEKLLEIQKNLKAPKNQRNLHGGYNFRSCEDILEAAKPLAHELGCVIIVEDKIKQFVSTHTPQLIDVNYTGSDKKTHVKKELINFDRFYIEARASLSDGDDHVSVTAYARESDMKKGMDSAQITGASSSYARKYALNGLFAIDDTKDADVDAKQGGSKSRSSETKSGTKSTTTASIKEPELLSAAQLGKIGAMGNNDLGWSNLQLVKLIKKFYGVDQLTKLTKAQASNFISKLEAKVKQNVLFYLQL